MQREIKKRLPIYGVAAVLLAIVLGTLCYNLGVTPQEEQPTTPSTLTFSPLKTFSSNEELRSFLMANSRVQAPFLYYGLWDVRIAPVPSGTVEARVFFLSPRYKFEYDVEYSTTNIQVAGVDEADTVKTDGEYIYLVANNTVFILKAYPPEEAQVLSKITFDAGEYPVGIFVDSNGSKLAVLGIKYNLAYPSWRYWCFLEVYAFIKVYDILNKINPVQTRNFVMSGSYFNSRMMGEYIYAVISQPAYILHDTVILPKIYSENKIVDIEASKIYYSNVSDDYYTFTTVAALNLFNDEEEPNTMTLMIGGTSNLYMSLNNIYITFHELNEQTLIYRIRVENRTLNWEAQGNVSGRELNQFSMDEFNDYFRVATTTWVNGTTQNNLYILDMNLSIVGKLENITMAYGEQIDSARFIGNRCYLATSVVRRDPFFVIDVENVTEPKVLGYLKIPGFTRYLHPYDENHVIGVGRDENNSVKISLFDVSNVSAPIEIDMYAVEGIWSDTPVLWDHKAFLFAKSKNLLAIPIVLYNYTMEKYWQWQGIYVFNVTLSGIGLRGNITHVLNTDIYYDSSYWAQRSFYIDDVLYTVSQRKVKMNDLADLSLINEVEIS
ncbi:MAG: beta-propeller domain-containing protein [Candidatus Bathycorpusculaceae bacterium]